jgi:hypothetical protein
VTSTTPTGATKRALRALVAADAVVRGPPSTATDAVARDPSRTVDEATDAFESVEAASRYLAGDGVDRLARAVVAAGRRGDGETVRRGRETLAALQALRAALDGRGRDW